jgi:hypothetical protein
MRLSVSWLARVPWAAAVFDVLFTAALVAACHRGQDTSAESPTPATGPIAEHEAPASEPGDPSAATAGEVAAGGAEEGAAGIPPEGAPEDPPSEAPASAADCETRKAAILAQLDEAARCKVDSDCTSLLPGCPFGCGRAVNAAVDLAPLQGDIAAYGQSCNRCVYRCRPIERSPTCRAGVCSLDATQP